MERDHRITGIKRGQSDQVAAPVGFEVNNRWKVQVTDDPLTFPPADHGIDRAEVPMSNFRNCFSTATASTGRCTDGSPYLLLSGVLA